MWAQIVVKIRIFNHVISENSNFLEVPIIKNVLKKTGRTISFSSKVKNMEAIKYKTVIKNDGVITLTGVPFKKGQEVEMIILTESPAVKPGKAGNKFNAVKIKTSGFKFDREAANER